jgi:hypothetical protein
VVCNPRQRAAVAAKVGEYRPDEDELNARQWDLERQIAETADHAEGMTIVATVTPFDEKPPEPEP